MAAATQVRASARPPAPPPHVQRLGGVARAPAALPRRALVHRHAPRARLLLPPSHAANPHPFYGGDSRSGDDDEDEFEGDGGDTASTSGSDAGAGADAAAARRALAGAAGAGLKIGADYGEGFTHFRPSSDGATLEPTHLDVDTLNDRLAPAGAARHRIALRPDEAHGAAFVFEGVLADTEGAASAAWARVAAAAGRPPPPIATRPALLAVRPERAITDLLHWTRDWGEARALAAHVAAAYLEEVAALQRPRDGVGKWWGALARARIPVAVVSELDRATVGALLERFGLVGASARAPFASVAVVAAEDGAETRAQALLAAAVKLGRPPAACVAFGGDPATIAAAHNASMAAVAVVSARHPAYSLSEADLKVGALDELTVQNVRRLFAGRDGGFMDLSKERVSSDDSGSGSGSSGAKRRLWADRPRGAAVDER